MITRIIVSLKRRPRYNGIMPPVTDSLSRLDIEPQGGPWRFFHKYRTASDRRDTFFEILRKDDLPEKEALSKLRSLVDLGLWDGSESAEQRSSVSARAIGFATSNHSKDGRSLKELHLSLEALIDVSLDLKRIADLLNNMIEKNKLEHVRLLVQSGIPVAELAPLGCLHHAVQNMNNQAYSEKREGNREAFSIANLLIEQGADINAHYDGTNALLDLVSHNSKIEEGVVAWLIEKGVDVAGRDHNENVALHYASYFPPRVSRRLIEAGCPIYAINRRSMSPLTIALGRCDNSLVNCLLENASLLHAPGNVANQVSPLEQLVHMDVSEWSLKIFDTINALHPEWDTWSVQGHASIWERVQNSQWHSVLESAQLKKEVKQVDAPARARPRL